MINYIEKGIKLHDEVKAKGYQLYQLDGVWLSDNDVAVQAIIDNFGETPVANWDVFNEAMLTHPRFIAVSSLAFQINPAAASSLPAALAQVTTNGLSAFTSIWGFVCYLGQATPEDREVWAGLAINNNLPEDFVAILRG